MTHAVGSGAARGDAVGKLYSRAADNRL